MLVGGLDPGDKVSQNWIWPAGRQGWSLGNPGAGAGLLVCWLGPDNPSCGAAVILGLVCIPMVYRVGFQEIPKPRATHW